MMFETVFVDVLVLKNLPRSVSLDQRRTKCDSTNATKPEVTNDLAANQPRSPFRIAPISFSTISMIYNFLNSI